MLFEASTPALCEIWKPLPPYVEEKTDLLEQSRTSTAPSAFPAGDVSGKVWSTQEEIYPKSSLGFAT